MRGAAGGAPCQRVSADVVTTAEVNSCQKPLCSAPCESSVLHSTARPTALAVLCLHGVARTKLFLPPTPESLQVQGAWDQADANGVNCVPLTLIPLELELDSVSCPKTGNTISG